MYAQGGVARGGATRGGYTDGRLYLSISGRQLATTHPPGAFVLLANVTVNDILNDTPNTCAFDVIGAAPPLGGEIVMTLGSINRLTRLFGGVVLTVTQEALVNNPANVVYHVKGIDHTWAFNGDKVNAGYTTENADDVAIDLVTRFTHGYTTKHIQRALAQLDVTTFTNQDPSASLTQIVKRIGGYWYVDYVRDVHLFIGDEPQQPNPVPLTPAHRTLAPNPTVTNDLSQMITRVDVEGGGGNALSAIAPGETILPVDTPVWYPTTGGIVATAPQRITYASVDQGSGGSLVGPGQAPTAAPLATIAAGAGVETGAHDYAVTWVTASGETKPSPRTTVTVGAIAPPTTTPALAVQAGPGPDIGLHWYQVTFTNASGETTPGPYLSTGLETKVFPNPNQQPTVTSFNDGYGHLQSGWNVGDGISFAYSYGLDASDAIPFTQETGLSPQANFFINGQGSPSGMQNVKIMGPYHPDPNVKRIHMWYSHLSGPWTWFATGDIANQPGNSSGWSVLLFGGTLTTGVNPPASNAVLKTVVLSGIPTGPSSLVTARKIYRTKAGVGVFQYLATLNDNTTTTYTDTTPDASLGANAPTVNTAAGNTVSVAALSIGPSTVTARNVYRTPIGNGQLKLVATIANNTATTYTDSTADASLGANAPTLDTSGLAQPTGNVLPGASAIPVASVAAFNVFGGWAVIGNGQQVIRYSGISGSTLIGIGPLVALPTTGGSGGGAGDYGGLQTTGASGIAAQGNAGGANAGTAGSGGSGGSGGGATGSGSAGVAGSPARQPGGPGLTSGINGTVSVYGVGGSGGEQYNGTAGAAVVPRTGNGGHAGGGGRSPKASGSAGASGIVILAYPTGSLTATGGTITTDGGANTVHTFTTNDTFKVTSGAATVAYLVVAGGGGAGMGSAAFRGAGGGGAGGVLAGSVAIGVGTYPVTVGVGGAAATDSTLTGQSGTASSFGIYTTAGGGGGGAADTPANLATLSGAIVAAIAWGSTITAAPALRGIPTSGDGSVWWSIAKGSPINVVARADNLSAQQQLAALLGGAATGIVSAYVQDNRLSYTEALARAQAELDLHDAIDVQIQYVCRDPTTAAGLTIAINLPAPTSLVGSFKIQSVTVTGFEYAPGTQPTYTVQASSSRFSLEDLLRLARAQQQIQGPV